MSTPKPTGSRLLRWFKIAVIVASAIVTLAAFSGIASVHTYNAHRQSEFSKEKKRLNELGIPTNGTELDAHYHVSDAADEAGKIIVVVLDEYVDQYETLDGVHYLERLADTGDRPDQTALDHMKVHLDANAFYMDHLEELMSYPSEVRYPMDLSLGFRTEFPWLQEIRNAVRMFVIRAQAFSIAGNENEAIQSLLCSLSISETLADDPLLILQLVRLLCHGIARKQTEYVLNAIEVTKPELDALSIELNGIQLDGASVRGFVGERCLPDLESAVVQSSKQGYLENVYRHLPGRYHVFGEMWRANRFLTFSEIESIGKLPTWDRPAASDALETRIDKKWTLLHFHEKMFLPSVGRLYRTENRAIAELETMRTAIAILRFARDTRGLVADLHQLVPHYLPVPPLDPFDGELLRYEKVANGFVVYSLGDDSDDDGGSPPPDGKKINEDGDVIFRILNAGPYLNGN